MKKERINIINNEFCHSPTPYALHANICLAMSVAVDQTGLSLCILLLQPNVPVSNESKRISVSTRLPLCVCFHLESFFWTRKSNRMACLPSTDSKRKYQHLELSSIASIYYVKRPSIQLTQILDLCHGFIHNGPSFSIKFCYAPACVWHVCAANVSQPYAFTLTRNNSVGFPDITRKWSTCPQSLVFLMCSRKSV